MTANELRIGNYVHPSEGISFPEHADGFVIPGVGTLAHLKVCAINPKAVTVEAHFGDKLFKKEVSLEAVAPIPLSENTVLKCDFQEVGFYDNVYHKGDYRIYLDKDNHAGLLKYETDEYHIEVEVKSVHQLQNLYFALSGKELEIGL